jgi:rod shape-determining protein MreB
VPKKGVIVDEPSVVAIEPKTREIIAVGDEAHEMLGRTSKRRQVVFPLLGGMICDYYLIENMVRVFLKRARRAKLIMPKAVICIPGEVTDVQKMAAINAIEAAGVRRVHVIEAHIAAAIGSGVEVKNPHGSMIVNIGAGTTDIAVISLNGLVSSNSVRMAGDNMDEEIIKYMKREHKLAIGKKTAETIKIEIGSVLPQVKKLVFRSKGRDSITGMPKWVDVHSEDISKILYKIADKIITKISNMLELTAPELVGDILEDGVFLSGGCAQLSGFNELIGERTGLKVSLVEDPIYCVARGTGYAISYMKCASRSKNFGIIDPLSME